MRMHRRDVIKMALLGGVSGAALVLAGCESESAAKPKTIKFGRDMCEHCTMLISDPAYAAELWNAAQQKYHLFDDIGCAAVFSVEQKLPEGPETRIWVANSARPGEWLDARAAYYRTDARSPMGYNFAALATQAERRVDFPTMRDQAVERGLCRPPDSARTQKG